MSASLRSRGLVSKEWLAGYRHSQAQQAVAPTQDSFSEDDVQRLYLRAEAARLRADNQYFDGIKRLRDELLGRVS